MMDAISFVLGVQSRHLRSTHLKELVFRKDANSAPVAYILLFVDFSKALDSFCVYPQARRANVKLVYEISAEEIEEDDGSFRAEGTTLEFCRSISAAGVGSYRLDGKDVTYEVYEAMLQKIGINIHFVSIVT
jgi:structural maintenance of chromosome 1